MKFLKTLLTATTFAFALAANSVQATTQYPLTIENCGVKVTFKPTFPKWRVV
jgi:hypothetical protein